MKLPTLFLTLTAGMICVTPSFAQEDTNKDASEGFGFEIEYADNAIKDSKAPAKETSSTKVESEPAKKEVGPVNFVGVLLEKGSRKPLADITVYIKNTVFTAVTDNDGFFEFQGLPPTEYTIVVPTTDYEKYETVETIVKGERVEVKYYMEPRSYGALEVVVRDKKIEKEVSRTVLTIQEAKLVPGTGGDPVKAIESLPGVARGGGGGGGQGSGALVIRGSNAEDSKIYLDGHELPNLFHMGGLKSVYNSELLDRFDLYTGGFTAQWGLATGGIVSLESRDPRTDRIGGYADLSMIDASALVEGPITKDLSIAVAARRSTTDLMMSAAKINEKIDGFDFTTYPVYYDYQAKLNYELNSKNNVSLDFYGGHDGLGFNMDTVMDEEPGMSGQSDITWDYQSVIMHWRHENDIFESDFSPGYRHSKHDIKIGDYFFNQDLHSFDIHEDIRIKLAGENAIAAGIWVDPQLGTLTSNMIRPPKEGDVNTSFANSELIEGSFEFRTISTSAYLQDEIKLGPVLFIPGVRFDHKSDVDIWGIGPRGSIRWQVADPFVLKVAGGLYHRFPDGDESSDAFGNSGLETERAIHAIGGFEWAITDTIDLDMQGYYKHLYNLVTTVNDEDSDQIYDNSADGYVYGGEVLLRHNWTDNFFGWISYSISRSMRNDGTGTDYRRFDIDQTHNLVAVASWQFAKSWRLGGRFQYTSGEPYTEINSSIYNADNGTYIPIYDEDHKNEKRRPAYHRLDLRLDKEWLFSNWVLHTYLDVQNVYVHKNAVGTVNNYDFSEEVYITDLPILPSLGVTANF